MVDDDDDDDVENNELCGHDDDDERVGDFFWYDLIVNGLLAERVRMESRKWKVDEEEEDEEEAFLLAETRSVVKSEFDEAERGWSVGVWTGERSGVLLLRSDIDFLMGLRVTGVYKSDMDDESCLQKRTSSFSEREQRNGKTD